MRRLMIPTFGYTDEARLVFRDGQQAWGGMSLFRGSDDRPFDTAEIELLASMTGSFARGVRTGLLCRIGGRLPVTDPAGPAVLIVGSDNEILQTSVGAGDQLRELLAGAHSGGPEAMIGSLVGAARRYARGEGAVPPRLRVRGASGMWLVMHGAQLTALSGQAGQVVVTIEEARPPEIVMLVVAAFDLTPRERDVALLVLQGVDTKQIALSLHVSTYTVQDHLKSVFEKTDVRSRRELIARVYFEQYVPRMGSELGPSGWFSAPVPA